MGFLDDLKKKATALVDEHVTQENIDKITSKTKEISTTVANYTEEKVSEGYSASKDYINNQVEEYKKSKEPINETNWYSKAATSCENLNDAILREDKGTSTKITKSLAGKLGMAGTSVGIFSLASLIGTASTGTAIGTLSGAAFTSASLAWLGGSVFMGSIILGAATIAGGIGAALGAGWVYKKYVYGQKRDKSKLDIKEQNIIDVCLSLATAFRQKEKDGKPLDPIVAQAMYYDALKPLCDELLSYETKEEDGWTKASRNKFNESYTEFRRLTDFTGEFLSKRPNFTIGIVSAVIMQLFSDDLEFNENEEIVLEALRRSNNDLHDATVEELASYVQNMSASSLAGLENNIKGIYHELRIVDTENNDGDEYFAEVFGSTNHAGADIKITNILTGEVKEIQVKTTSSTSYINEHFERYSDISVTANDEVASKMDHVDSSGFTNEELTSDVRDTFDELDEGISNNVASSMTVSALVCLAKNSKVLLKGDTLSQSEKEEMVKGATIAAGTSAVVSLILG